MPIRKIKDTDGTTLYIDEAPQPFWNSPVDYANAGWGHNPDDDLMHYFERLNSVSLCHYFNRPLEVYPGGWSNTCEECETKLKEYENVKSC